MTMAALLLKGTAVMIATLLAMHAARGTRAAIRHMVLATGFAVLLLLPLVGLMPAIEIQVARPATVPAAVERAAPEAIAPSTELSSETAAPQSGLPLYPSVDPPTLAAVGWVTGTFLVALPLLVGLVQLRRARRLGGSWPYGEALLRELTREAGMRRQIDVVLHESAPGPVTCGAWRPTIMFPPDAIWWVEADVRRALIHELEHVRRQDWLVHCIVRLVCAMYWFHPLVWVCWRYLGLEAERACDDAVLRREDGAAYAGQLLTLAERLARCRHRPVLAMANRADLRARIGAVLDGRRRRDPIGARGAVMALLTVIAAVVLSSVQTVTAQPSFDVASIRRTDSLTARGSMGVRPGGTFRGTNISALNLITMAYRIPGSRVLDAPGWATDERYVIEARSAGLSTLGDAVPLVMSLLRDRFKLVARTETRELPVYLLRVARSDGTLGPRMRNADPECLKDELPARATAAAPPGGMPCLTRLETGRVTGGAVNVGILLSTLTSASGRPVLNRTDLGGFYDIDLEWAPTPDADGVSIFTAVEEQLGLRLESGTAPLDVVVVERIERPTDN